MSSQPLDVEAIRASIKGYKDNYVVISPSLIQILDIDAPALCDEVEYLWSVVTRIEANNIKMQDAIELYEARVKALEAANEMLMADAQSALVRALIQNEATRKPVEPTKGEPQAGGNQG